VWLTQDALCSLILEEGEWKLLYCAANKTGKESNKPYMVKKAVDYLGTLE
jgi:hypothetical protein